MGERIARLALTLQGWTGWSREQPERVTVACDARRGQALGLREFGVPEGADYGDLFNFQIRVMTLLADRAFFEYQHLAIMNANGTINLSGPHVGTFMLKAGQQMRLATPTMDGGLLLTVWLDRIDEGTDEKQIP